MVRRKESPKAGEVAHLKPAEGASPERVAKLRQWHIDQAISDDKPVAIINFTLTASGEVKSRAVLVEEEHAQVMLPAMVDAIKELGGVVDIPAPAPAEDLQGTYLGSRKPLPKYWHRCEICHDELHVDNLHEFDAKRQGAPRSRIALLCGPCHLSASATASIRPSRLNLI